MRVLTPSACCATLCAITLRAYFSLFRAYAGNGVIMRERARKRYFSRFSGFSGPFHQGRGTAKVLTRQFRHALPVSSCKL